MSDEFATLAAFVIVLILGTGVLLGSCVFADKPTEESCKVFQFKADCERMCAPRQALVDTEKTDGWICGCAEPLPAERKP